MIRYRIWLDLLDPTHCTLCIPLAPQRDLRLPLLSTQPLRLYYPPSSVTSVSIFLVYPSTSLQWACPPFFPLYRPRSIVALHLRLAKVVGSSCKRRIVNTGNIKRKKPNRKKHERRKKGGKEKKRKNDDEEEAYGAYWEED